MRRMIVAAAFALAVLLPAAASAAPPAPPAAAPALLAPDAAAALAGTPGVAGSSVTRSVTPLEAFAAASSAGAIVSIAPGLSLQQAVGLRPANVASVSIARAAAAVACSANDQHWSWGTWPYEQKLSDTTYWCAAYGDHITYTSSTPSATGTFCGPNWTSSGIISGGIGYSWFVVRSSAGWTCPTVIPWVSLHPSHHLDVSRNAWGSTQVVGAG